MACLSDPGPAWLVFVTVSSGAANNNDDVSRKENKPNDKNLIFYKQLLIIHPPARINQIGRNLCPLMFKVLYLAI